jgi:hypothetical protein
MNKPIDGMQKMADKDNILRARDIIPDRQRAEGGEDANEADIPQFSLADDILAEQRRRVAQRRQKAGVKASANIGPVRRDLRLVNQQDIERIDTGLQSYTSRWDPLIADIVSRDIERLCKSGSWS